MTRLPDFATGHLIRARVHADRGDDPAARDAYERVLQLDPVNTAALREAASLARDRSDPVEALRLHQRLAAVVGLDDDLAERIRDLKRAWFEVEKPVEEPVEEALEEPVEEPLEETIDALFQAEVPQGADEPEPADEPRPAVEPEPGVVTRTLGELYARQGHSGRALDVYRKLVDRSPGNASLRARMEELEAEVGGGEEFPDATGGDRPDAAGSGDRPDPTEDGDLLDPTEELAREWAGPHEKSEMVTSPFTWGDDEVEEPGASRDSADEGPSIASYFDELLSRRGSDEAREGGAGGTEAGGAA